MGELKAIEKAMKTAIPIASGRPWESSEIPDKPKGRGGRRGTGRPGGGGAGGGGGYSGKPGGGNRRRRSGGGGKSGGGQRAA